MSEEVVSPPEEQQLAEQVVGEMQEASDSHDESTEESSEKQVPLSALQKMRKRAQEAEFRAEMLEKAQAQQSNKNAPEEDYSRYESATKEDLGRVHQEAVRLAEERFWMKQNPERYDYVNENLQNFLKQRPNLAYAINSATNRYEEAYVLMEALTPRQKKEMRQPASVKKDAPNSPASIPKTPSLNEAVDVMSMSDSEFSAWRKSQKRR